MTTKNILLSLVAGQTLLLILKIFNVLAWSYWWILSPSIMVVSVFLIFFFIAFIAKLAEFRNEGRRRKEFDDWAKKQP